MITAAQGVLAGLSHAAAILLEEICRRYPDAKATFGGHLWLAVTRKQLQQWTGFTEWQIRKSLDHLKWRKFIEVGQHKNESGLAVSFIRPLVTELASSSQSDSASPAAQGNGKHPLLL